jgi:hypothetical protein
MDLESSGVKNTGLIVSMIFTMFGGIWWLFGGVLWDGVLCKGRRS